MIQKTLMTAAIAAALIVASSMQNKPASADGDMASYKAALPLLEEAGGGKTCTECFIEKYAPAVFTKAFAVSKDGAYGGRWKKNISMDEAREGALASCRKKPTYNPANPCVVFFENDKLVWKP